MGPGEVLPAVIARPELYYPAKNNLSMCSENEHLAVLRM